MKKKWIAIFSAVLLVSPSLIGTGQVVAETIETEQSQELETQESSEGDIATGSAERTLEDSTTSEPIESIVEDSTDQSGRPEGINESPILSEDPTSMTETVDSSLANAVEEDLVSQEDTTTGEVSLTANTVTSGHLGTVDWEIDADGTLHIGAGQLSSSVMSNGSSPFFFYSDQITSIIFDGKVTAGDSLEMLFYGLNKVTKIENLSYLDTSQTTSMHYMFCNMSALTSIDVSRFDTSKVTDMRQMFSGASSLSTLDVSKFDTSSVIYMGQMFYDMRSLTFLDLSNFETPNLTNMMGMFSYASIKSLDISNFNTLQATMGPDTFWQTPLEHIKLGENFVFKDSLLGAPPIDTTYIGKWQKDQSGPLYTSLELATNYMGATMKGDWYWATSQESIEVIDSSIYEGDKWEAKDNFIDAKDKDGNPVAFEDLTVEGTVDTTKAGTYEVKYSYDEVTSIATITVKAIQTAVNIHDSIVYIGSNWRAEDNFDSAVDKDGGLVDFEAVTVEGTVDTTKAGTYEVKYSYDGVTSIAKITVQANQTVVNVHDSTLYIGMDWKAEDNFDSVLDGNGDLVDFGAVTVEGTVDTTKVGTYEVKYSYNGVTSFATIIVQANQTAVNVHDSTLYIGTDWKAEDNFDSAVDKDGNSVDFGAVIVEGSVDTAKVGTYEVKYSYDGVTSSATITVKEIGTTAVNVHDSTVYIGSNWKAEDNFDSAVDENGDPVGFEAVTVEGMVDTTKVGTYEVKYSYDGVTSSATITVKEVGTTAVNVHDSTLYIGTNWKAEDNFDSAVDEYGNPVGFEAVTVEGSVDTTKVGTYRVTYSYAGVTSTAAITVRDKQKTGTTNNGNKGQNSQNISNTSKNTSNKKTSNKNFPHTGEQTNNIWQLAGVFTLLFSLFYLARRKKVD
ncbi:MULTISPECIES: bacterial Ig-like domain-containing protein [unclassified Enterococcus]|uniref:bacterial Ig-like domain-containing protein n=1 Tax=unclassified Enterococcus TaxID=2608891 RepID=UPI001A9B4F28|nr:bacterial Ig-like domain-containing protein [Enterococcus sp. DIV1271a]MBO1300033.1 bacterial Ig-like domain-containing protein [Enterococcus sp. DIV1271a]